MTGLLSAISGQFTKALILGALFPSVVFVLLWIGIVAPLLPPDLLPSSRLLGAEGNAIAGSFFVLVVAGLLYHLDVPLIKFYEGYPWRHSWLGRWLTDRQASKLRRERRRAAVFFELTEDRSIPEFTELITRRTACRRALVEAFPDRENLVLPTRLGNVIRAFERYPSVQYGIDAIHFWPRMVAVIPAGYAAALADARISLVFLLNLSFLFTILSIGTAVAGLYYQTPEPLWTVAVPAIGFALLSIWLHRRAISPASAWGELVKGAFDLYRWDLLKELGYEQRPRTRTAERELWRQITQQGSFGDKQVDLRRSEPRVRYADPSTTPPPRTRVHAHPEDVGLALSRGVERRADDGSVQVVVQVANVDAVNRAAADVVVVDTCPDGTEYRWNSARVGDHPVRVVGTNPYHFHIGGLRAGTSTVLSYAIFPPERGKGG